MQLRLAGAPDWPANPALAPPRFRTQLRPDGFTVRSTIRGRRLEVTVELLEAASVAMHYVDPDGETATRTTSERATATVTLYDRTGGEQRWVVDGRAHAEVGTRPAAPRSS
ncbi:MAG TPA: hypothetical protein VFV32_08475 [Acidimicrobiales bacterium]|nr:hypothetical protein [Acidimicrobiales bacterium]